MKKCLKNKSKNLSIENYNECLKYLYYYNKCKNFFFNKYYNNISAIYNPNKFYIRNDTIKNILNKTLNISEYNLLMKVPADMWKSALFEVIINLKSIQSNIKRKLNNSIINNKNFTTLERQYLLYLIKSNNLLHLINNKKFNTTIHNFNVNNKKLNSYLYKKIKKFNYKPFSSGKYFYVDGYSQVLYNIKENKLICSLSTLKKRQRIKFELSSKIQLNGYIKILLKDNFIEFHKAVDAKQKNNDGTDTINIYYDDLVNVKNLNYYINTKLKKYNPKKIIFNFTKNNVKDKYNLFDTLNKIKYKSYLYNIELVINKN